MGRRWPGRTRQEYIGPRLVRHGTESSAAETRHQVHRGGEDSGAEQTADRDAAWFGGCPWNAAACRRPGFRLAPAAWTSSGKAKSGWVAGAGSPVAGRHGFIGQGPGGAASVRRPTGPPGPLARAETGLPHADGTQAAGAAGHPRRRQLLIGGNSTGRAGVDARAPGTLHWLQFTTVTAGHLWDEQTWRKLAIRHVQLARGAGAFAMLMHALNTEQVPRRRRRRTKMAEPAHGLV